MIIEIKVPTLPESVSEATLMTWNKKVGEFFDRDDNLIDLETDKVVLELPAPHAGVLLEIIEEDGATVVSGQLIAKVDTAAVADATPSSETKVEDAPAASPELKVGVAMPAAAKIAAEKGLDTSLLTGSGKDGRVLKEDVQKAVIPAVVHTPVVDTTTGRPEQRVPMSRLRQRVAERLLQSQAQNAILTTFNEVNMQPVMDLRAKYKDKFLKENDVKLGFMSFFIKAVVGALKKFPVINASIDGNDIVYHGYFDIGVAIGSPRGLVVPILRNADQMTMAEIEQNIANFAVQAKNGKLALEDLTGGTFSITNGGTFGSMMSTPIINPPQAAILGMHATKERAMVENGQVVVRPMMYLALSYDHRLIDGREAVLALVALKELSEDPARLVMEI